tara:strand:+ start:679 stop:828 length:150 start_codon:yes stop_codon:yes gene_type:complete
VVTGGMNMKVRDDIDFANDMRKYSKEELINKLLNMRSFLLELVGSEDVR